MARFADGDRVIATKNRPGIVRRVFPARVKPTYSVEIDGQPHHEIFHENELRAQSASPATAVCCGKCGHGEKTLLANARRCVVFKQFRSAGAPRRCDHFSPLKPTEAA